MESSVRKNGAALPTWLPEVVRPNAILPRKIMQLITLFWVGMFFAMWILKPFEILPTPMEVFTAFGHLWNEGISEHLWTSMVLNFQALVISSVISLLIAYLTVLPLVRVPATFVATGRFLGMTGITLIFTLAIGGGHMLKLWLLVFGMTVFYATTMIREVANIPREEFDDARTLRMGHWHTVLEVVIIGGRDKAIDALRQNAAIGWMLLTMVEGISRSEGGIGVLLLDQNKHFKLPEVYAIQLMILVIGMTFDFGLGVLKRAVAPYAHLTLVRG